MNINPVVVLLLCILKLSSAVRLHKLFQFIDGFRSEHNLTGFVHIGNDYTIFLRAPKPHDKHLIYELYETKNLPEVGYNKPKLLAISKVPVDYIKDQLKEYRAELYNAKYENENVVPGTQVKALREWQIDRALKVHNIRVLHDKMPILRTVL